MDVQQYNEMKSHLFEILDARYQKIEDCDKITKEETKKTDRLTVEFAKSNIKLNILVGILSAIAVPLISMCVKSLFA